MSSIASTPRFVLGGFVALTFFMLCGPGTGRAADPPEQVIEIKGYHFMPATLTVPVGTKITWINKDQVPHTVVEKDKKFHSSAMDTGDTYSFVVTSPETLTYFCSLHTQMVGVVTVTDKSE